MRLRGPEPAQVLFLICVPHEDELFYFYFFFFSCKLLVDATAGVSFRLGKMINFHRAESCALPRRPYFLISSEFSFPLNVFANDRTSCRKAETLFIDTSSLIKLRALTHLCVSTDLKIRRQCSFCFFFFSSVFFFISSSGFELKNGFKISGGNFSLFWKLGAPFVSSTLQIFPFSYGLTLKWNNLTAKTRRRKQSTTFRRSNVFALWKETPESSPGYVF